MTATATASILTTSSSSHKETIMINLISSDEEDSNCTNRKLKLKRSDTDSEDSSEDGETVGLTKIQYMSLFKEK